MIALNKLETKTGVYVFEIVNGNKVNNIELHVGDIIVEFENKPVASVDDLHKLLNEETIGKLASIGVLRGGRKEIIHAKPSEIN
jgi:S1-C subfamily serine protease